MRRWTLLAAGLLAVGLGSRAAALYREWGPWKPGQRLSASFWPAGAEELANRKDRTGGYMLNAFDRFYFRGDAAALNAFLKDYARVEGQRRVLLVTGEERAGIVNPRLAGADWEMSISHNSFCGVTVPADGAIRLEALRVPVEVDLEAFGEANPEVRALTQAHHERQKAGKRAP